MAIVQVLSSSSVSDGYNFFPGSHWDTNTFVINLLDGYDFSAIAHWETTTTEISNITASLFQGYFENWDGFINPDLNDFGNLPYVGYTSNWGQTDNLNTNPPTAMIDVNSFVDHPKNQLIYYKLKGYNTLTSSFESWVVTENITTHPESFDPGRHIPSIDKDVNRTPPSLNNLINITIVARWIQ